MNEQLTIFGEEEIQPRRIKPRTGGSQSSIVFNDYEGFLAKFADNPKTTDDCFTPRDVYEAVVKYVGTVYDMTDKVILRPFFPGGDYVNADYPENGVVIDNPPFSMFTKIVAFYSTYKIPFFLFGPGMTITSACRYCTAVFVDNNIIWENGAVVRVDFASNLYGDLIATTAPTLRQMLADCPSQRKPGLPQFNYPAEVVRVSDFHVMCCGDVDYSLRRSEVHQTKKLDGKDNMFGEFFLVSTNKGQEKEAARLKAQETARLKAQEAARLKAQDIELSDREKRIVEKLTPTPITNRTTNPIDNRTDNPIDNRVPTPFGTHVK